MQLNIDIIICKLNSGWAADARCKWTQLFGTWIKKITCSLELFQRDKSAVCTGTLFADKIVLKKMIYRIVVNREKFLIQYVWVHYQICLNMYPTVAPLEEHSTIKNKNAQNFMIIYNWLYTYAPKNCLNVCHSARSLNLYSCFCISRLGTWCDFKFFIYLGV